MRTLLIAVSALALAACSETATAPGAAPDAAAPAAVEEPVEFGRAGTYDLDLSHASLIWRVSHFGLSKYTGRFTDFSATLNFNPDDPAATSLTATINPLSVETDYPGDYVGTHPNTGFQSWNEDLAENPNWFNGAEFPQITFTTTGISPETASTGKVTGNLSFRGATVPVTLDVKYNGVAQFQWAPNTDVIGFSARGTLKRSDFGMGHLQGPIGDEVEIIIEAEFRESAG
ncbi:YceI family protein [Hyphomonas sp.]|uniref:YceI family protein n=1 Tax=Hyphomonas sp. TaxID=87 RepID=UPI003918EFF0